jgi:hypothetical protein
MGEVIGGLFVQIAEVCPQGLVSPNIFSLTLETFEARKPDLLAGHTPCICGDTAGSEARTSATIATIQNMIATVDYLALHPEHADNTYAVEEVLPDWTHRSVFALLNQS